MDASQGVEAQTVANFYLAFEQNLAIIPVLNKIDMPAADPDRVARQLEESFDLDASDALAIDPGIGFGKTLEHNLALLRALPRLCALGPPVLVGTSRKSFLGRLTGVVSPSDRLAGSLASAVLAARDGARILRVHDAAATVEALADQQAIDAGQPDPEGRGR